MLRLLLPLLLPLLIALQGCSAVPSAPSPPAAAAPTTPPPLTEIPSPQIPSVDQPAHSGTVDDMQAPATAESVASQEPAPKTGQPGAVNMPASYMVNSGDTLWTIAARPEIYNDPLLWMLLYQANRDQIMDPRHVYPGQTLRVPRNISAREREELREAAQKSTIFPTGGTLPTTR